MIQKVRALKKKISSLHKKLEVANDNIEGKKEAYENSIRYKENIQRQIYEKHSRSLKIRARATN